MSTSSPKTGDRVVLPYGEPWLTGGSGRVHVVMMARHNSAKLGIVVDKPRLRPRAKRETRFDPLRAMRRRAVAGLFTAVL